MNILDKESLALWMENDLNPFFTFDRNGKIVNFNRVAEFLLSKVGQKRLYDLALKYASSNYGFNTAYISLKFGRFDFYALSVGYNCDEYISLKLYKNFEEVKKFNTSDKNISVNLFTLVNLSKSTSLKSLDTEVVESFDPTIPNTVLDVDNFLKLLNYIYTSFNGAKSLKLSIYLKIGEYIKIDNKKHQIIELNFEGDYDKTLLQDIHKLSKNGNFYLDTDTDFINIELPMILE
jgi:hypothetical protein